MRLIKQIASVMLGVSLMLSNIASPILVNAEQKISIKDSIKYNNTLSMMNELESIAIDYYNEEKNNYQTANRLLFVYIRNERYHSTSWNWCAGSKNEEFETYVANHQSQDLSKLKTTNKLVLPTGEITDFVHMIGTMNMIDTRNGIVGGWGGDTIQFAGYLKSKATEDMTENDLFDLANNTLGKEETYFDYQDIYADLDAVNLYQLKKDSNMSWYEIFNIYYNNLTNGKRMNLFLQNVIGDKKITTESELQENLFDKLEKDTMTRMLRDKYNVGDKTNDLKYRKAACYSLASLLFKNDTYSLDDYINIPNNIYIGENINIETILPENLYVNDISINTNNLLKIQDNKIVPLSQGLGKITISSDLVKYKKTYDIIIKEPTIINNTKIVTQPAIENRVETVKVVTESSIGASTENYITNNTINNYQISKYKYKIKGKKNSYKFSSKLKVKKIYVNNKKLKINKKKNYYLIKYNKNKRISNIRVVYKNKTVKIKLK